MIKALLMVLGFSVLAGCATDSYTCGQFPESGCQPVSVVYKRTNDGFHDYRHDLYDEQKREAKGGVDIRVGQAHKTMNYVSAGDPVLTKPVVLRILMDSYEDEQKDLIGGGFVYVRLRDAEWVIQ